MASEQDKTDNSSFGTAMLMAAVALLLIIIGAVSLVSWRAHKKNHAPYDKHPLSRSAPPVERQSLTC